MRRALLTALAALTLLSGCATPGARTRVAEFRPGSRPDTSRVWVAGELFLVRTDGPDAVVAAAEVGRWDAVGFRRGPDGAVVAVAGGRTFPVAGGEYEWVRVTDRELQWSVAAAAAHRLSEVAEKVGAVLMVPIAAAVVLPFLLLGVCPPIHAG
ncbi:MAG: hypothetical protein C0501_11270 [Isosphaera sp.]|nr:hypothetical protein [Isosphaera sp.]